MKERKKETKKKRETKKKEKQRKLKIKGMASDKEIQNVKLNQASRGEKDARVVKKGKKRKKEKETEKTIAKKEASA